MDQPGKTADAQIASPGRKTAVVTGASSGIGKVAARELARSGYRVILLGRDKTRSDAALGEIRRAAPHAQLDLVLADLTSLAQTRRAADEIERLTGRIDVLINNAGAIRPARQTTEEGYEATFAGNHLGPFLLTNLLLPLIEKAAPARIVTVSSSAHRRVRDMKWDDLHMIRDFGVALAYGQSKLANLLFTRELARRLADRGVTVYAMHPGVVATRFGAESAWWVRLLCLLGRPFLLTEEQGADTIIWLASDAYPAQQTGGYFVKRRLTGTTRAAASDEGARRLWQISEELTGL